MKRREFGQLSIAATFGAAAISGIITPAAAQAKGYVEITPPVPTDAGKGQVEVIEFFSYGCSHCKNFEPMFSAWKKAAPKYIKVKMEHVGFNKAFEPLQKMFYALEAMGETDKLHAKLFTALQTQKIALNKTDILFPWIEQQGIDRKKFEEAYKSFGVASRVRRALELQEAYKVEGTPALGIAGKYYTDGSMARGFENMIQITNTLSEKEHA